MVAGRDYEIFVQNLQQALLDSEEFLKQKNIRIERNKKIADNFGIVREFDLYWEYELGGVTYKTIIECKDYSSRVSVEKIDALIGKIRDIPDLKPVFATKVGYQSGAKLKAKNNKIELLVVREQNDTDWEDEDGTPLIKIINANITLYSPIRVTGFKPVIDAGWAIENTDFDVEKPFSFPSLNTELFIDDKFKKNRFSLFDLESKLTKEYQDKIGQQSITYDCNDAYIETPSYKLKLHSLKIEFIVPKPFSNPFTVDLSKELIGVIEYLHKDRKTTVFRDKIVNHK
ncbi:restriction endonuclease [Pseudoalteromonas sp. SWYJ118]|uniref:restriction endonuclease n=1 Tax=Pseudoalteromonas sp. SWYJ118 TaxID=2792062 RepID=UPI0018CE6FAC|nr:restriction endonuclease [Pseudoalteromonas sp. SWYJ118]MBH0077139.1 restriction endonuclease [Pseudoalteromonas sp. SWYJ118]